MAFVISSNVHLLWSWLPDEGSVKSRIEIDGAVLFVSLGRVVPSVFIMSSMGGMFYRQTIQQDAFIYGNRQARGKVSRVTLFFLSKFIINEHMFEHMVFPLPGRMFWNFCFGVQDVMTQWGHDHRELCGMVWTASDPLQPLQWKARWWDFEFVEDEQGLWILQEIYVWDFC